MVNSDLVNLIEKQLDLRWCIPTLEISRAMRSLVFQDIGRHQIFSHDTACLEINLK
jgi:hypothetical protein